MNTKKTLVAVIAALLVAATLPCFAKGNVVTQWKMTDGGDTYILTFYSDKTVEQIASYGDGSSEKLEGTYSGNTTKNGKISMVADDETLILEIAGDQMRFDGGVLTKVK
ncbi:MAG: hypothetical protein K2I74_05150 [Treponemataceae bacterium]|nr:hypothetical protein [Treponemataceae bacterium]